MNIDGLRILNLGYMIISNELNFIGICWGSGLDIHLITAQKFDQIFNKYTIQASKTDFRSIVSRVLYIYTNLLLLHPHYTLYLLSTSLSD